MMPPTMHPKLIEALNELHQTTDELKAIIAEIGNLPKSAPDTGEGAESDASATDD